MTALQTSGDGHGDVAAAPRRWPLLEQPPLLAPYVSVVVALHAALIGVAATHTTWCPQAPVLFGALLACGAISIEASRRLGMPAGVARDLLSAWWLPGALLMQPVYALLMPIPLQILLQLRVRRTMLHRRVIVTSAHGLAGAAASATFHAVVPHPLRDPASWLTDLDTRIPMVVLCAVLFTVVNTAIVVVAAQIANTERSWRDLLWNREILLLDLVEICVGILITISCAVTPTLLVIALPPVMMLQRSLMHTQLRAAARLDSKTGLLNAATWQLEAGTEISRAVRTDESLALLLIDIDHFKRVNDAYGHLTGDQVLAGVAATLVQQLREYDVVGRFGGEEFAVLLPNADMLEACRVAERLRSRVGRMCVPADDATITVTISIGVALFRTHGHDLIELLASADLALYRAKESGRNRICLPATKKPGEPRRITARPSPRRL
ncbi:GGDEF domain-containing protein [Actinoallomurus sp. NPDC052274]|uniref:sensor domain-containing diguanylate cyclase n=1 Tax=Actinoallomurus sp. NPDC052274 TaxID=3155420 RepID=UPI00341867EB